MRQVTEKGSEPARFAFAGSQVLFNKIDSFADEVRKATEHPKENQAECVQRFYAQFEAWHWYCVEAIQKKNQYLLGTSVSKFILFSGRLILAHNELLYPYHKWFLKVLEQAKDKPKDLLEGIHKLNEKVKSFRPWIEGDFSWHTQFMLDSEPNWLDGKTPIDDV